MNGRLFARLLKQNSDALKDHKNWLLEQRDEIHKALASATMPYMVYRLQGKLLQIEEMETLLDNLINLKDSEDS